MSDSENNDRKFNFFNRWYFDEDSVNKDKTILSKEFNKWLLSNSEKDLTRFYEVMTAHECHFIQEFARDLFKNRASTLQQENLKILFRHWLNYPVRELADIFIKNMNNSDDDTKIYKSIAKLFLDRDLDSLKDTDLLRIEFFIDPYPLLYRPISRRIQRLRDERRHSKFQHQEALFKEENEFYQKIDQLICTNKQVNSSNSTGIWQNLMNSSPFQIISYLPDAVALKENPPSQENEREIYDLLVNTFQDQKMEFHETLFLDAFSGFSNLIRELDPVCNIFNYITNFPQNIDYSQFTISNFKWKTINYEEFRTKIILTLPNQDSELKIFGFECNLIDNDIDFDGYFLKIGNKLKIDLRLIMIYIKPLILWDKTDFQYALEFDSLVQRKFRAHKEKDRQMYRKNQKYRFFLKRIASYRSSISFSKVQIEKTNEIVKIDTNQKILSDSIEYLEDGEKINSSIFLDIGTFNTRILLMKNKSMSLLDPNQFLKKRNKGLIQIIDKAAIVKSSIIIDKDGQLIFNKEINDDSTMVLNDLKYKLSKNLLPNICVAGETNNLHDIFEKFLKYIHDLIDMKKFNITNLYYSYPVDCCVEYKRELKIKLNEIFGITPENSDHLDEGTCACLGLTSLKKIKFDTNKYYLIIDSGGGTTDCALLNYRDESFRNIRREIVISKPIGGSSIEQKMYYEFLNQESIDEDEIDDIQKEIILEAMRGIKHQLILNKDIKKSQSELFEIPITFTKSHFDDIIEEIWENKFKKMMQILFEEISNLGIKEIDAVILAGGNFHVDLLKNRIKEYVENHQITANSNICINTDNCLVVSGLTSLKKGISIHSKTLNDILLQDPKFKNTKNRIFYQKIFPKGTEYPTSPIRIKVDSYLKDTDVLTTPLFVNFKNRNDSKEFELDLSKKNFELQEMDYSLGNVDQNLILFRNSNQDQTFEAYLQIDDKKQLLMSSTKAMKDSKIIDKVN